MSRGGVRGILLFVERQTFSAAYNIPDRHTSTTEQNFISACAQFARAELHTTYSQRIIVGQGALCMCACVCVLSALSRCVFFRQCTCQDVSSLGRGPCVCVCVCLHYLCPKCIVKMCLVFRQCTCQDVLSLSRGPCVCMCVCLLHYFCPKCIVKMCRLSAMHLSRCVVFGQGALCVCSSLLMS